jgi:hypothetical protein
MNRPCLPPLRKLLALTIVASFLFTSVPAIACADCHHPDEACCQEPKTESEQGLPAPDTDSDHSCHVGCGAPCCRNLADVQPDLGVPSTGPVVDSIFTPNLDPTALARPAPPYHPPRG